MLSVSWELEGQELVGIVLGDIVIKLDIVSGYRQEKGT